MPKEEDGRAYTETEKLNRSGCSSSRHLWWSGCIMVMDGVVVEASMFMSIVLRSWELETGDVRRVRVGRGQVQPITRVPRLAHGIACSVRFIVNFPRQLQQSRPFARFSLLLLLHHRRNGVSADSPTRHRRPQALALRTPLRTTALITAAPVAALPCGYFHPPLSPLPPPCLELFR